jgi:hypothetical protein
VQSRTTLSASSMSSSSDQNTMPSMKLQSSDGEIFEVNTEIANNL